MFLSCVDNLCCVCVCVCAAAGIQTSSTNTQYSEQFVVMFTLVMTQLKQVK